MAKQVRQFSVNLFVSLEENLAVNSKERGNLKHHNEVIM